MTSTGPLRTSASGSTPAAPSRDDEKRLRGVAHQLEGVFVEQLFKAMRETVPQDGIMHGGSGEEIFTGLLDQKVAATAPTQWSHGIGESLVHQLAPRLRSHSASPTHDATGVNDAAAAAASLPMRTR